MGNTLTHLFSPLTIRGQKFRNRIFSSGQMAVMLKDGLPGGDMVAYHAARARGGAALIILEAARAPMPRASAVDLPCAPLTMRASPAMPALPRPAMPMIAALLANLLIRVAKWAGLPTEATPWCCQSDLA